MCSRKGGRQVRWLSGRHINLSCSCCCSARRGRGSPPILSVHIRLGRHNACQRPTYGQLWRWRQSMTLWWRWMVVGRDVRSPKTVGIPETTAATRGIALTTNNNTATSATVAAPTLRAAYHHPLVTVTMGYWWLGVVLVSWKRSSSLSNSAAS